MANQNITGAAHLPRGLFTTGGAPSLGSIAVTASGMVLAAICQAPKAGIIRKVAYRVGTLTTAGNASVDIRTVDSSGCPSASAVSPASGNPVNVAMATGNTVYYADAGANAGWTVTAGQTIAVSIQNVSGNFQVNALSWNPGSFPYNTLVSGYGGFATVQATNSPNLALEYSDGSYAPVDGVFPMSVINTTNINSGTANPERGVLFTLPFPATATGGWAVVGGMNSGSTVAKLYSSDQGTLLAAAPLPTHAVDNNAGYRRFQFSGSASLSANTNYYLTLSPDNANNTIVYDFQVWSGAILNSYDLGQSGQYVQGASGSFTVTDGRRVFIGLSLGGFSDGVGTGGGNALSPINRNLDMYRYATSGQQVYFTLASTFSGLPITGAASAVSGRRALDGAALALVDGTISEDGGGLYHLNAFSGDLAGKTCGLLFTASGASPVTYTIHTTQANPDNGTNFGLSCLPSGSPTLSGGLPTVGECSGAISQRFGNTPFDAVTSYPSINLETVHGTAATL